MMMWCVKFNRQAFGTGRKCKLCFCGVREFTLGLLEMPPPSSQPSGDVNRNHPCTANIPRLIEHSGVAWLIRMSVCFVYWWIAVLSCACRISNAANISTTSTARACFMRYQSAKMVNKSIDFENPSVFELLASNYTQDTSPFFDLLHRSRDCIALSYWINNEPDMTDFRGYLKFACGVQELLHINLLHRRISTDEFCLAMLHGERPLELYDCPALGLSQTVPIVMQAHVGSMVVLSQEPGPDTFHYLLFQRVTRYADMLDTLRYFERRYNLTKGTLRSRNYHTSQHWMRCNCDQIIESLAKVYQCLGINRKRSVPGELTIRSVSEDMLVMAAIGIGGGVTFFLLLKIRLIC
uniref:Uncharacterized protein n=1 Tax=Anopheles farauti TaxID=69004 RepID=A0A182Q9C5_9DIPT